MNYLLHKTIRQKNWKEIFFQVISEEHPPNWNQLSKIHRRQSRD